MKSTLAVKGYSLFTKNLYLVQSVDLRRAGIVFTLMPRKIKTFCIHRKNKQTL